MDLFAKRYGWSIEYILGLTRKQVRILMISAGDHERMPDKDEPQDEENLLDSDFDEKAKRKAIKKMRDSIKLSHKSNVVERMKNMSPEAYCEYLEQKSSKHVKKPSSPIKAKRGKNLTLPPNASIANKRKVKTRGNNKPISSASTNFHSDILKMANKGGSGVKMGNRLRKKLRRK